MQLIKLYSEDNVFREVTFQKGINLICGEKSLNSDGTTSTDKQNGVGKSLVIELINFCLLKKSNESRVTTIKDDYLPKKSYVCLHFRADEKDYIFARNKKGDIKIKEGTNSFAEYEFDDAKSYLTKTLGLTKQPISARELLNFLIKEEDYSYKDFAELYRGSYADLLKVHFYFFDLPIPSLEEIKKAFDNYQIARGMLRKLNEELASQNLDIKKLRAVRNQHEAEIKGIEGGLSYPQAVANIQKNNQDINIEEQELNQMIFDKKKIELDLLEITDFSNFVGDDFYIDENDLQTVFNKYKTGLGNLIKKDFDELKKFKNQVMEFKLDFLKEKQKALIEKLELVSSQIKTKQSKISTYYGEILDPSSNNLVKNFRLFKNKFSELDNLNSQLHLYEKQEQIKEQARTNFVKYIKEIDAKIKALAVIEKSFKDSFMTIHVAIMNSSECDFTFLAKNIFMAKSFFKFNIYIQGQGSKGVDQMQAVIYDLALLNNEYTQKKHLKFLIHDNLIFGSVDKDSSIKTLNYLNSLDPNTFQYIATVNKDDFNYKELASKFTFNPSNNIKIELTKKLPLFPSWIS